MSVCLGPFFFLRKDSRTKTDLATPWLVQGSGEHGKDSSTATAALSRRDISETNLLRCPVKLRALCPTFQRTKAHGGLGIMSHLRFVLFFHFLIDDEDLVRDWLGNRADSSGTGTTTDSQIRTVRARGIR